MATENSNDGKLTTGLIIRLEITNKEAGAIYSALMTLRQIDPKGHDAIVQKLKVAQEKAIAELVRAEFVEGKPQ